MKGANSYLGHCRSRGELEGGQCLKLIDSDSILSQFSKMLIDWRWIPVNEDVCRVQSYSTGIGRSANRSYNMKEGVTQIKLIEHLKRTYLSLQFALE